MKLFEYDQIMRVSIDEQNKLIVHEWFDYNPESGDDVVYEILDRIYEASLTYPYSKILVIADRTRGAFSPGVFDFIDTVQFPRLKKLTVIKYVATVINPADRQKMATEMWQGQLSLASNIQHKNFLSEQAARDWLKNPD